MSPAPSDSTPITKNCYVEVVGTSDEWEGLIGVVQEFQDADGNAVRSLDKAAKISVLFPLSPESARRRRLHEVNDFTDYVRGELRQNNSCWSFLPNDLEWFNPDEL